MPAKSGKEYRFMAMIAHNKKKKIHGGPSPKVAEEIVHKTSPKMRSIFMKKGS